jgi:hypothetical protein
LVPKFKPKKIWLENPTLLALIIIIIFYFIFPPIFLSWNTGELFFTKNILMKITLEKNTF